MSRADSSTEIQQAENERLHRNLDATQLLERMERVPFSRWHAKARIIMGSATFFDAFNALSLAFALPILIRLWHISPKESGLLISSSYIGQLIGALAFSALAEKWGRIRGTAAAVAIMSIMNFGCALAGSYSALLACRFIQGIGVGGEMPVAATYINELSQTHGRGRFFLLYEMIFPIGLMATGQIGALLVPAWGWKSIFLLGGVPGILIAVLIVRLPESPRWLISKARLHEAESIIREIEQSANGRIIGEDGVEERLPQTQASDPRFLADSGQRTRWSEVFSAVYRQRTMIAWILWVCAYFVANSLNNWMPSLYNTVYHLSIQRSLRYASLTNVAQVAILLVCAFCVDRIGRRNWMTAAFAAGAGLLLILGFLNTQAVTGIVILATLSYGIIGSTNAVLYLYTPEIYPTRMRAIGTGLATSWLRVASAVGPALVGFLVVQSGTSSVFLMFAAVAIVGALTARSMIETRDKSLEEIAP